MTQRHNQIPSVIAVDKCQKMKMCRRNERRKKKYEKKKPEIHTQCEQQWNDFRTICGCDGTPEHQNHSDILNKKKMNKIRNAKEKKAHEKNMTKLCQSLS